jgi:hypothetical protein
MNGLARLSEDLDGYLELKRPVGTRTAENY